MPELPASVRVAAWVTHAWAGGVTLTEAVERALPDVDAVLIATFGKVHCPDVIAAAHSHSPYGKSFSSLGIPLVAQMGFATLVMCVLVFMLVRAKRMAKKAGRSMAEQRRRPVFVLWSLRAMCGVTLLARSAATCSRTS